MPRARLIVINGPPACGKTTLVRRYADAHPPALHLDISALRELIGGWQADPVGTRLLARNIALAAARLHLSAGHDVVAGQFLSRPSFYGQLADLAKEAGASFREIVLMDSKQNALARFAARELAETGQPARMTPARVAKLSRMHDDLVAATAARPEARLVQSRQGEADRTYADLLDALA
ncbi:MAG TPA: AAA family ATPase [Streptosporangiaceae bacterium]|jgi:predicted kinase